MFKSESKVNKMNFKHDFEIINWHWAWSKIFKLNLLIYISIKVEL